MSMTGMRRDRSTKARDSGTAMMPLVDGTGVVLRNLSRGLIFLVSVMTVTRLIVYLRRISRLLQSGPNASSSALAPTSVQATSTPKQTDFQTDAVRFKFDALLQEYDSIRRQIEILIQQQERTFHYLIALIAGLLASQLLVGEFPAMERTLNSNPSVYLAVALAALWFPTQNVLLNSQIAILATYLRTVLTPKVNEIVRRAYSPLASQHALWEGERFGPQVQGALSWEEYYAGDHFERRRNLLTFAPLWFYRFLILSLPSIICTARYVEVRWVGRDLAWSNILELPLIFLLVVLLLGLLIGGSGDANITRTHQALSKGVHRIGG